MRTYKYPITKLRPYQIFVCGVNTEGRHGKGAALWAKQNAGLIYGHKEGICGQTYTIVTKNLKALSHPSISRKNIEKQIEQLYQIAIGSPKKEFLIAYTGFSKNLNGYSPREMADMFAFSAYVIPDNIVFEEEFFSLVFKQ